MFTNCSISPESILKSGPVIPVLVENDINNAIEITKALLAGNVKVIEVTLRTPNSLKIIESLSHEFPEAIVGAGTVTNMRQFAAAEMAGAKFCISPGSSNELLMGAMQGNTPLIPGVSTVSEAMCARNIGYKVLKFFPAEAAGGPKVLSSIAGPFPDLLFCPTGGININNAPTYLNLANVLCVGGSWLVPSEAVKNQDWQQITSLAAETSELCA
ncbi:bifunctional 4-hydroxy-2-oxoglutarate aldolase/2-dehydro-3-deoxy-phosphogluconate aldolase [Alteromonas gilva]|uniref:Bifunctional 4-hydroxy-2-oxoglutarate aldolase/2-dehydro-3-deoxy-phosphogluconate aldolase n=1 Tax=Alteromonas gilva TaxID=2987522 RepID=A0ABT5L487_9ALTE|nr:bifunctional 4-hydroxy-2-oxoglutarate aldolase/2-dehydro-3-deoxy-phosphogluconate aldolase [Alteromonas gilva]MDC8831859.1 bifunctional 4-hydroxy-2-oxoglutarate aldolase/2-dehydro-3-deoxy-phosphogluconate aldolase [Alteromonas gilva]